MNMTQSMSQTLVWGFLFKMLLKVTCTLLMHYELISCFIAFPFSDCFWTEIRHNCQHGKIPVQEERCRGSVWNPGTGSGNNSVERPHPEVSKQDSKQHD